MRYLPLCCVLANVLVYAEPALAQEPPAHLSDDTPDQGWHLTVSPYVWTASLHGNAELAGFRTRVDMPFSEIFDHLDFVTMGEVVLSNGKVGAYVDGQYVKTSQDASVYHQQVGLGIKKTHVSGGLFYNIIDHRMAERTVHGDRRRFTFAPVVGLRWSKLSADVAALGLTANRKADWTEVLAGIRTAGDIDRHWVIDARLNAGGFSDRKSSMDGEGTIGYRLRLAGLPLTVRAGYRFVHQQYRMRDFTGQQFRWNVSQEGPLLGLSARF